MVSPDRHRQRAADSGLFVIGAGLIWQTRKERRLLTNRLITKFRENYCGFWKDCRWFIVIFVLALFCDAGSTIHFMLREGPDIEIHPAIQFVSGILGPIAGPLLAAVGKAVAGVLVCIYCRRWAAYILVTASIISFWASWYNIWGFKVYTPLILKWIPW